MGDCTIGVGSSGKMVIVVKSTAWDAAAAAVGAEDRVPFISESVGATQETFDDPTIDGSGFRSHPLHVGERHEGAIEVKGDYRMHMRMIALAMGIAGTPVTREVAAVFEHRLDTDLNLCDIYGTLGIDRVANTGAADTSGWIYDSVKFSGLQVSLNSNEPVNFTYNVIARDAADGQTVAPWTYVTGQAPPSDNQDILGPQGTFRINAKDDIALSASDNIDRPTTAQLTLERNMAGSLVQGSGQNAVVDEPVSDDLPSVSLQLDFESYTQALHARFIGARRGKELQKMEMRYLGNDLGTGDSYEMAIQLPNLKVNAVSPTIAAPGRIPLSVEMSASAVSDTGDVAGMPFTGPFRIVLVNERDADPLG